MNVYASQQPGGFTLFEVKCPSCGGSLRVPDGSEMVVCSFCGTTVRLSYSRRDNGVEPDGTIRDRASGYGLFRARIPMSWQVSSTTLRQTGSISRPYVPEVELRSDTGGYMSLRVGEGGTRRSAGLTAMMSVYGGHLQGIDTANYAEMPNPIMVADNVAYGIANGMGAANFTMSHQFASPSMDAKKQEELVRWQRAAQAEGGIIGNPFIAVVLRTYDFVCSGQPWNMAVYVLASAVKDGSGVGDGFTGGFGDFLGPLGNLFGVTKQSAGQAAHGQAGAPASGGDQYSGVMGFLRGGGLVGKMQRDRQAAAMQSAGMPQQPGYGQPQQGYQQQGYPQQAPSQGVSWCSPDFAAYTQSGTIYWSITEIAVLTARQAEFAAQFESTFLPLVDSLQIHPDVENLTTQSAQQYAARVQQATQTQLAQNQAAFQAQQAAHRQQQAAFDSYLHSIQDASDAHHRQFMASSHAQFEHRAPDYSEAIRGVNTYTTSDGREVQVSVQADHAWENQAGDVIGTAGSFDPGSSWTELPRT